MKSGLLPSLPMVIFLSSLSPVLSQGFRLGRALSLRVFFTLEYCGIEIISQPCGAGGGSVLILRLSF